MKSEPDIMAKAIKKILADAAAQTFEDAMNGHQWAGASERVIKEYISFYKCGEEGEVPPSWLDEYMESSQ